MFSSSYSRIMSSLKTSQESLKSKFRGCLAGVLLGDCLGVPFEGKEIVSKRDLHEFLNSLDESDVNFPVVYSDDTAMTKSIAESLVENKKLDEKDIARRFTDVYYEDKNRGYGQGVIHIFSKWQSSNLDDYWSPAQEQFSGDGSFGNGGAMRIAPVALFCHGNYDRLINAVTSVTKLTHTNPLGVCGALFQSIAIQQLLELDSTQKLDEKLFLKNFKEKIEALEEHIYDNHGFNLGKNWYYRKKINTIEKLLEQCRLENVSDEEVVLSLGNSVDALNSVPTALFCFLRSLQKIPHIKTENVMRRTIEYAISLGGDTDTIASMAAALTGSYFGEQVIPPTYLKHAEAGTEIPQLGEKLYNLTSTSLTSNGSPECDR